MTAYMLPLLRHNAASSISIHKMNAYLHKLLIALHPHLLGKQPLYLCLHKLWTVKKQLLSVLNAPGPMYVCVNQRWGGGFKLKTTN